MPLETWPKYRPCRLTIWSPNALIVKLQEIVVPRKVEKGDADDPGIKGKVFRVTDVREGIHVEIGGRINLRSLQRCVENPEAEELVSLVAAKTIGHNTIIKVTGHTTKEYLPPDSAYGDAWGLSYARARRVADVLVANGIRPA